jgi:hypothetical protein
LNKSSSSFYGMVTTPKLRLRCRGIKFAVLRRKEGLGLKGWKFGTVLQCSIISGVYLLRPGPFGLRLIGLEVEVFGRFQFLRAVLGVGKKLLNLWEVAKEFLSFKVGTGHNISLWFDAWHPTGRLLDIYGFRAIYNSDIGLNAHVSFVLHNASWNCPLLDRMIWLLFKQGF